MAEEKTALVFNCGIIQCNVDMTIKGYTCTIYFNNWYTLMDFYTKTINGDIFSVLYTHPPIQHKRIISGKFKIPYLKITRKPNYLFNSIKDVNNIFLDGCVRILFSVYSSTDYINIMQKVKEYCYNNNFFTFYRSDFDKLSSKLTIFDGLDNDLRPIFKEIKTEGS